MNDSKFKRRLLITFAIAIIGALAFVVYLTCWHCAPSLKDYKQFETTFLKYLADVRNTSLEWDKRTAAARDMQVHTLHAIWSGKAWVSLGNIEKWMGKPDFIEGYMHEYIYANPAGPEEILLLFHEVRHGYIGDMSCIVTTEHGGM